MQKIPSWVRPDRFAPQFSNHPLERDHGKIFCLQTFQKDDDGEKLRKAGVTHVWQNTRLELPKKEFVKECQNLSTIIFGKKNPTREEVRSVANGIGYSMPDGFIVTDEFAEGSFPQDNPFQTSLWFYERLGEIAQERGIKFYGFREYASADADNISHRFTDPFSSPRDPMNPLYLNMLEKNGKQYVQGVQRSWLDTGLDRYTGGTQDWYIHSGVVPGDFLFAKLISLQINYNIGAREMLSFGWSKMQTTAGTYDGPERHLGNIRPGGKITIADQIAPAEQMKWFGFFGMNNHDGIYHWGDNGISAADENSDDAPRFSNMGLDAVQTGVRWYTNILDTVQQAGGANILCDYTADGKPFKYSGTVREMARAGKPQFGNYYLNEAARDRVGACAVIPGREPKFWFLDPYGPVTKSKQIVAKYDGKDWPLGKIPGTILYVS
jgi:hypothetical protein